MEPEIYSKTYLDASEHERSKFVRLVSAGGAVKERYITDGIKRQKAKMVFLTVEGKILGVAALKVPGSGYRRGIESPQKANFLLPEKDYPYELGYVAVEKEECGFGKRLTKKVVELAGDCGMFATTSSEAVLKGILPRFGFKQVGNEWSGNPDNVTGKCPSLRLLIKRPSGKI